MQDCRRAPWREAFDAWWAKHGQGGNIRNPRGWAQKIWHEASRAPQPPGATHFTVVTDAAGNGVAVTLTDDDGQIVAVLWEKGQTGMPPEHGAAMRQQLDAMRKTPNASGNAPAEGRSR